MAAKYHINAKGEPALCKAGVRSCPLNSEHYETAEKAREAYENSQNSIPVAEKKKWTDEEIEQEGLRQKEMLELHIKNNAELNDEEYEARREYIRQINRVNQSTHKHYTKKIKGKITYIPERDVKHIEIVEEISGNFNNTPKEGRVLMTGGLPGSGKTTIINKIFADQKNQYATLNPDEIKIKMIEREMAPEIGGLTPLETDELIMYESQIIYRKLYERVTSDRTNILIDKTMMRENSVRKDFDDLRNRGYTEIHGVFADIDTDTAYERIVNRHREGINEYIKTGGKTYGERVVPGSVIMASRTENENYRSRNSENMASLIEDGLFTGDPRIFNTDGNEIKEITFEIFSSPDK